MKLFRRPTMSATQWGIQYGDGEVDGPTDQTTAVRRLRDIRSRIIRGELAHEPMRLVKRTHEIYVSEWEDAR